MSDHIIGGKTEYLKKTFTKVKKLCEDLRPSKTIPRPEAFSLRDCIPITETIIFTSFLKIKDIEPNVNNYVEIMKNNLEVVDIAKLGDFQVRCNTNDQILNRPAAVIAHSDGIRSIDDLCAVIPGV